MAFRRNNRKIKNLPSFRYGLNNQKEADEINDVEVVDIENFTIEDDTIKSAQGYIQWDTVSNAGPYWGVQGFRFSNGNQITIRQRQGALEYAIDGEENWTTCTLPTTGSPASPIVLTQKLCTFAMLNDTILFSNGAEYPMSSTDGITWTLQTGLPKSEVVFNNGANRIIFAKQPANPSRIDWTDINTPLTIGAVNYQLIDPNNGEEIIGMGKTPQGTNIVFKRNSLYEISDYTTEGALDVNFIGNASCVNHQTICTTENSIIWAGWLGVYELIGGTIRLISGQINPVVRDDTLKGELFCGAYYNFKYHLSKPDTTYSTDYNCQEYIFHKKIQRPDPEQPYAITRNRRFFGCYGIEDFNFDYGRDITLYAGDSRPSTTGSPAVVNDLFCWINDYRDPSYASGLNGQSQCCYIITKFYNNDIPFYVKKFKKLFASLKLENTVDIKFSYRFLPYGSWYDVDKTYETEELNFILEDGTEGGFSEGYGFFLATQASDFISIENSDRPRGIQFKLTTNQINDVTILGLAYEFTPKIKFR